MTLSILPVSRPSTGHIFCKLATRNMEHLQYSGLIDDELWNVLDYYSEIESAGIKHMINFGIPKTEARSTYKLFSAHIRQAKNYYYSAKGLPNKSSALLYYYCFLNLAQSIILLKNPSITGCKLRHGLKYTKRFSSFSKESVVIDSSANNIFPILYECIFNQRVSLTEINISKALAYCTDMSYQYSITKYGPTKVIPAYYSHIVNKESQTGWALLALARRGLDFGYKKSFKKFNNSFEQVTLEQRLAKEIFEMNAREMNQFNFYQSRKTINWPSANFTPEIDVTMSLRKSLEGIWQPNYFDEKVSFYISLPYSKKNQTPVNEIIASYVVMFYLSSLVRYRPDFLEKIYSKKDMWLIDSFIKFCPVTFLRNAIPLITNTDYVLLRR